MNTTRTSPSLPLAGKTALVTGGSRSIDAAIAKRLAADATQVAFNYVGSASAAEETATAITAAGGRAVAIRADAGDPGSSTAGSPSRA